MYELPWTEYTYIGFDTETSGKYPLQAEICELAAVKWKNGKVIDTFSTLLKPTQPMGPEVIAIHGITNEMVANAPDVSERIGAFYDFIQDGILVAHHAPFDLGFVAIEFEKMKLALPTLPVICSSLLSRKVYPVPEIHNHRLQTLIEFFKFDKGTAHRALDDAKGCLNVALKCMERLGANISLDDILSAQGGPLYWQRFSMRALDGIEVDRALIAAIRAQKIVEAVYSAGSSPGESRRIHPLGLVRSLDGDFLIAYCEKDQRSKRYFLDKISNVKPV